MPIPTTIQRPDLILAADCVYFEPAFPLLVQTLNELSDSTTEILFSYKKRRKVRYVDLLFVASEAERLLDRLINAFSQYSRRNLPGKRWMFHFDHIWMFLIGIIGGYGGS
jgi:predicted nicotinamide N-methyase